MDSSIPSRLGKYKRAAISSDGAPCSDIGRLILAQGGNAVDAAIGALFCNAVVNPQSAGLGGGFHMTVYDPVNQTTRCLDARETAPMAATENMFENNLAASQKGGLAVAVPGELAGYWAAHQAYGRLPWSDLVLPAATMAENGVSVNRHLAETLGRDAESIKADPSMRFFVNGGQVLRLGDTLKMPVLAETLRKVAQDGVDIFYQGAMGDMMIEDIQQRGGILTKDDLRQYRAEWVEPVQVKLSNNLTLYSLPPPGSGVLTAYIMRLLDGHLGPVDFPVSKDPVTYHRMVEAFKHAFGQRTKLGDPKFYPQVNQLISSLLSDKNIEETRLKFNDFNTCDDPEFYGAVHYNPADKGTSHVSVLDADGMAVSITSTINLHFGAGFASEQTGIILNNEMADFSPPSSFSFYGLPPSPSNFIRPGKRPLSSMTPVIVVDSTTGRVRLVIGAAGGIRITTSTVYAMIRNLWFGENIKEAIDSPRFHHQLLPMTLHYEEGFPTDLVDALSRKGHAESQNKSGAAVYGISVEPDGYLYANADYRKGGDVAGF